MGHTEGGNRREEDRLPRLEGAEWQGLLSCLQWKGGKNRRQNLRFFVPHHSPYILHSNGAQTALSLGQVLGTRISSQVGDLPKGEDKITKRDKITCPDKMMAQCGTTLLSGLGGRTWQALVVPTVARKTVTLPPLQDLSSSEMFDPYVSVKLLLHWPWVGERDWLRSIWVCNMELV